MSEANRIARENPVRPISREPVGKVESGLGFEKRNVILVRRIACQKKHMPK